ncbi:MAG: type IV-A pilus assembly ATPase PilB, partial [Taibaiella sp.]|nr:type IV-A pilus assembly ATPase PilB [Taibaiella sp.]
MTAATQKIALSGLPRRLVEDNLLSEEVAQKSLVASSKKHQQFVTYLVENKLLDSSSIALSASQEFGVPLFQLEALDLTVAPIGLVDEKLIRIHHALPIFRRGNRLFLAVSDPTNIQGLDEIKFHTGLAIEAIVVEEEKLVRAIESALEANDTSMSDLLDADLDNLDISSEDQDTQRKEGDLDVDDAPVVRFVNKMLLDAINSGASDIHFEPYEKTFRVRLRQDGILHEVSSPPV